MRRDESFSGAQRGQRDLSPEATGEIDPSPQIWETDRPEAMEPAECVAEPAALVVRIANVIYQHAAGVIS